MAKNRHTGHTAREREWLASHGGVDLERHGERLLSIIQQVDQAPSFSPRQLRRIVRQQPRENAAGERTLFSKHELIHAYHAFCEQGRFEFRRETLRRLQMKPMRTLSGVAPVTVLTKPFPCPGKCIFCPTDVRMPKSYLPDEPGAMRAAYHHFDPFEQTAARIRALENVGHPTDKIELLILGGTWSYYPEDYQEWFLRRCFDAMNEREAASLPEAQSLNEQAPHRSVGLVIETRPDWITPHEITRLRQLGVTKVQLGVQSLDDEILAVNGREHTVEDARQAMRLLRLAGFKIAVHWMPNLLGATPASDRADFRRLWTDPALRPDELKIYPCALLAGTPLYDQWQKGTYHPYTEETLVELIAGCKADIPPYCRVNRITRDIPAPNIVAGSTRANLRQIVQNDMAEHGRRCRCIRCREVRRNTVDPATLGWQTLIYPTDVTQEYFVSAVTPQGQLAGFLRLSLPKRRARALLASTEHQPGVFHEIENCAMIRQVHVYGPALSVGAESSGAAQHIGIGRELIERAVDISRSHTHRGLAVIAAIGTRDYYRRWGFDLHELYMTRSL
jgi:elongator complex protein 3